jgi:DNA repair protein SbcC/Rad50
MRLESIRLKGLGPFRAEFAVDLTELGDARLVAVIGPNGAGKSTLLELWGPGALYRSTPTRGALRDLATERAAYMEARVVNGQAWTIRHTVDAVSGKGESVVLDAAGAAVLSSAKLKEFDQWSSQHLPAPEVFFSTVFSAQGASGFLGMKPAERKAVLLRVLGVERLEQMAERAREHARRTRTDLQTLEARIADERARSGDVDELAIELESLRGVSVVTDRDLAGARTDLAYVQTRAAEHRAAADRASAVREQRRALMDAHQSARTQLAGLEQRVANNRAVLAEADQIRAAVATRDRLAEQLAQAEREELELHGKQRRVEDAIDAHERTAREAQSAHHAALERNRRALARLGEREAIELAVASLEAMRLACEEEATAVRLRETELETLRARRVAGSEERVEALRGGLRDVVELPSSEPLQRAQELAGVALAEDDDQARQATELPYDIDDAQDRLHAAQDAAAVARRKLTDAEALAARAADLAAAQADADQAIAEAAEHSARAARSRADRDHAAESRAALGRDRVRAGARVSDLRAELTRLDPIARKAEPLARAEARLAELEPQQTAMVAEVARLGDELAATPEPDPMPAAPDIAYAERLVALAEDAARRAHADVAVAEQRLADARAGAARLAELEGQRSVLDAELADWVRLADDLGRDGLQALEIDAAGPELSELVNDLLRNAYGPRWTVTIETQRLSADGKRQLEGCEVRVLDTVGGREAEASTFSGGERVILGEAVSLALSMLACRRAGVEGPTLVRDESGAALDPANARAYVAMLRRAADIVGARHVLFVSHSAEVQELADARIEVGRGP